MSPEIIGMMVAWFAYGALYSTLRRKAVEVAIFEYNGTSKKRPLLLWLFFTKRSFLKEDIYCYNWHGGKPCGPAEHNRHEQVWSDYQPDHLIAIAAPLITVFRIVGLMLFTSLYTF